MFNIIYNPCSNHGNSKNVVSDLIRMFNKRNIQYKLHETEYPKHATQITETLDQTKDLKLIIVGGDGTIFEVVNGIKNFENIKIGIVPSGTGNDIAKMLRIPENTEIAVNIILEGKVTSIDLNRINKQISSILFTCYGIVINVIMDCRKLRKKSKLSYYFALFKNVYSYKKQLYTTNINGKKKNYYADFISIQNSKNAGGGMTICREAIIDDGYLDLLIIEYKGIFRRYMNLIAMLNKKLHLQPNVIHEFSKEVKLEAHDNHYCCIDGEVFDFKVVYASNINGKISFFN